MAQPMTNMNVAVVPTSLVNTSAVVVNTSSALDVDNRKKINSLTANQINEQADNRQHAVDDEGKKTNH